MQWMRSACFEPPTLNAALSVMFSMTSGTIRSLAKMTAVSPIKSAGAQAEQHKVGHVSVLSTAFTLLLMAGGLYVAGGWLLADQPTVWVFVDA